MSEDPNGYTPMQTTTDDAGILKAPNGFRRAQQTHEAIARAFLAKGGTPEQWCRVCEDPRKFNLAWNRLLGLPDSHLPPPAHLRNVDPNTGEIFEYE